MPQVKHVKSEEEYNSIINGSGDKLVVVDFSATWCGPCRMIAPVFERLSDQYTDVVFVHVDVNEVESVANKNDINAVPTFLFYKNGQSVARFSGASEEKLKQHIEANK